MGTVVGVADVRNLFDVMLVRDTAVLFIKTSGVVGDGHSFQEYFCLVSECVRIGLKDQMLTRHFSCLCDLLN